MVEKREKRYGLHRIVLCFQNHWLKTDFDKWQDEDDSDVDESGDKNFEDVSIVCVYDHSVSCQIGFPVDCVVPDI